MSKVKKDCYLFGLCDYYGNTSCPENGGCQYYAKENPKEKVRKWDRIKQMLKDDNCGKKEFFCTICDEKRNACDVLRKIIDNIEKEN